MVMLMLIIIIIIFLDNHEYFVDTNVKSSPPSPSNATTTAAINNPAAAPPPLNPYDQMGGKRVLTGISILYTLELRNDLHFARYLENRIIPNSSIRNTATPAIARNHHNNNNNNNNNANPDSNTSSTNNGNGMSNKNGILGNGQTKKPRIQTFSLEERLHFIMYIHAIIGKYAEPFNKE